MPALAVVGPDHQIIRSTESFRRKYQNAAALCERSPELDLVLKGQTNAAVVDLGDFSVAIEAVTDAAGERQAVLTLPSEEQVGDAESAMTTLREAADESAAIVWVKDLEGRYLYANARFEDALETSNEKLRGKTDAELPRGETVDGPRLNYARDGLQEPLQLEYIVPAFEGRPAMAAFRFPLRDEDGHPIATCGVAAPSAEALVASDEAVRLMELERWSRLDPLDLRAELLEQWQVQTAPSESGGGPLLPAFDVKRERRTGQGRPPVVDAPAAEVEVPAEEVEAPAEEVEAPAAEVEARAAEVEARAAEVEAPVQEGDIQALPEVAAPEDDQHPHQREDEGGRQVREAARIAGPDPAPATAALQSDLQLARKWAERAEQLQTDLQEAHAQLRQAHAEIQAAQAEAQQAISEAERARAEVEEAHAELARLRTEAEAAAAKRVDEQASGWRAELEQAKLELERETADADAARSEVEVARSELAAALAQLAALKDPAEATLRLSSELERTLAAEREREDELAETLARIRSRLGDLNSALEPAQLG